MRWAASCGHEADAARFRRVAIAFGVAQVAGRGLGLGDAQALAGVIWIEAPRCAAFMFGTMKMLPYGQLSAHKPQPMQ